MKLFNNTLKSTAQPDIYYTDSSNLPKEVQEMLSEEEIELFKEASGGGTRVRLNDVKIHGWVYDISYTIDYVQDFDIHFQDLNDDVDEDDIEAEMFQRAEVFLADGLVNDVYVEVVDNDMKFAVKVRNMSDASTDLLYFESDEADSVVRFKKELDNLKYEDEEDYDDVLDKILRFHSPKVLENINWRKMKKDEDSIDSEIYADEITDDYYIVFNKVAIDI